MPTGSCTLIDMRAQLSTAAKYTRISMTAVIVMFLAVAAILAPRLTDDQPLSSPLFLSQVVGLAFFGGAIYSGLKLEGITPEKLRLMLGVNCLAGASLAGIALSPTDPLKVTEDA